MVRSRAVGKGEVSTGRAALDARDWGRLAGLLFVRWEGQVGGVSLGGVGRVNYPIVRGVVTSAAVGIGVTMVVDQRRFLGS